jgi:hydrophobe/amphiphile efflux-1 (HAE1) family protein
MSFSRFFIDRPIFATVLSIVIIAVGLVAYVALPVSQWPEVAPPTITVSTQYPGASSEVVANTVATPLEQEVNGVEGMLYMLSNSTGDGRMTLTITFKPGTDLDQAQVLVQNRVAVAEPRLPEEVRRIGVVTRKASPDILMVVHLISPDKTYDQLYISNYATLQLRDVIARTEGVGSITIFGARDYAMRIWLDPDTIASLGLTAGDVLAAVRAQNLQVAGGAIGAPPVAGDNAFQTAIQLQGRLDNPEQFGEIVVFSGSDGRLVRLKDVARIELAAADYQTNAYLDGQNAVVMLLAQQPGTNALATAERVKAQMETLSKAFPKGLEYRIVYNPTEFIQVTIDKLVSTIIEAVLLVVLVVLLFLQRWRAAIIPIAAIPVSLIGTFAVLAALGFSLNMLSLYGLVLAIGIVVDDAIIVVENVERFLAEGLSPRDAVGRTMDEVGGALVATALVLGAVFVPTAFLDGITGEFYRQFAVTISVATAISCFVSLTLSPALAALLLRPHDHHAKKGWLSGFFDRFNAGFDWIAGRYASLVKTVTRRAVLVLAIYVGFIGLTVFGFAGTPTGFVPQQDQGYYIVALQLPNGASVARTDEVVRKAETILLGIPGVAHTASFAGFSGATRTNATNAGAIFVTLKPFDERVAAGGQTGPAMLNAIRQKLMGIEEAFVIAIPPPPIQGLGTSGGFTMMVQDRAGFGPQALERATWGLAGAASQQQGLVGLFTTFSAQTPQIFLDVDRVKAQQLNVPVASIFEALSIYLGSAYVNDFNILGRTYRVLAQADAAFRFQPADIAKLRTRSASGAVVPIGSVANVQLTTAPDLVQRFNLYPAAALNGNYLPSMSSGQALATMEGVAQQALPSGFGFEWTDIAYQEKQTSQTLVLIIFALAVFFVFLVLAAQYESWSLPLAIILIVPMCLLAALGGVLLRGFDNNILVQIGFVVLVGLASKNAILIVEFAKQLEDKGMDRFAAAAEASRLRLRPILMTSLAFILGVVPLATAAGAGAEMSTALGTAVLFGMLGVTIFGLIFTPVFYTVIRGIFGSKRATAVAGPAPAPAAAPMPPSDGVALSD